MAATRHYPATKAGQPCKPNTTDKGTSVSMKGLLSIRGARDIVFDDAPGAGTEDTPRKRICENLTVLCGLILRVLNLHIHISGHGFSETTWLLRLAIEGSAK